MFEKVKTSDAVIKLHIYHIITKKLQDCAKVHFRDRWSPQNI